LKRATTDTFFDGRLQLKQHAQGYRFSIDAVLLASFVRLRSGQSVVDLGTGCGIIALILGYRFPRVCFQAVEIQADLAALAEENIRLNRMTDRVSVLQADVRRLTLDAIAGPADVVLANPPYRRSRSGRVNPDEQRAVARHEIRMTLADLIQAAARLLKVGGRFATIYPAERLSELVCQMAAARIEPKRLRAVQSGALTAAKLILIEGVKGGRKGLRLEPPLVLYGGDGRYGAEVQAMLAP
jgi:tRNA1Val (adenine37-N6)-methyltransferase